MRVDHEKREIVCGVGDLVHESTYRRIGVERGDGFRRMWIGQDIHTRRAEAAGRRGSALPRRGARRPSDAARGVERHRHGTHRRALRRQGRRSASSIEEVKSIHFDLELEALYRSEKLQRHLYQLLLYSYFLSGAARLRRLRLRAAARAHRPRLRRHEDHRHRVRSRSDVETALHASLAKLIEDLETALALRVAKRAFADTLQFPFDGMRAGAAGDDRRRGARRSGSAKRCSSPRQPASARPWPCSTRP